MKISCTEEQRQHLIYIFNKYEQLLNIAGINEKPELKLCGDKIEWEITK